MLEKIKVENQFIWTNKNMKTFKQFYSEAYNLQEIDFKGALTAASKSPLINNPITRTLGRAVGPVARGLGAMKAVAPESGPIGRAYGAAVAVTPPGVSNALQFVDPTDNPTVKKVDKQITAQHTKAYKANPTGYTQMLGRSF